MTLSSYDGKDDKKEIKSEAPVSKASFVFLRGNMDEMSKYRKYFKKFYRF